MNSHIQKPRMDSAFLKLAASLTLITLTPALHAADGTWTGGNGTWNDTATNWSGVTGTPWDSTNGPNNAAIFGSTGAGAPVSGTVYTNRITFNTTGGLGGSGTINLAGTTPTITNNVTATITTILDGTAGLTKNGTGELRLSGNNTYSGNTVLGTAVTQVSNANALGSTAAGTIVNSGAQLRLSGGITFAAEALTINGPGTGITGATRGALSNQSGNNTYTGKITLGSNSAINARNANSALTLDVASGDAIELSTYTLSLNNDNATAVLNINDSINGSGGVTMDGAGGGTAKLNAANTYTGTTTLKTGTLALGNVNALQNSTLETSPSGFGGRALTFTAAGNSTYNLGGLSGDLAINNGGNTLSVGANNANTSTTGVLSGAGGLTKTGNGTLTLGNTQLYTGATTINLGTLLVNAGSTSASSTVTVASGATLGGNGIVGGATTVNGDLKPGNSPGLLTFSTSLTLGSTANTTMEITGANSSGTRGVTYDAVNVGSALTYGGTLLLNFDTLFTQDGNYTFNLFDSASTSGSFGSVSLAGVYSGSFTNTNDSGIWGLTQGDNTWSFKQSDGVLSFTVVPEPNVAMVAGSLALMALLRRRRD